MKVEFVRWSCGCEGIRFPGCYEDAILFDCTDDSPRLSAYYKDKPYEPLSAEKAIKHVRHLVSLRERMMTADRRLYDLGITL